MKKTAFLLAIILLFSTVALGFTGTDGGDGGYIVSIAAGDDGQVSLLSSDLDVISSEAGLYRADSLVDIKKLGDSVIYYEKDCQAQLFANTNDALAGRQWDLDYLGVQSAWDKGYEGAGIRVAVIDSGVNSMHEDFAGTSFEKGLNLLDGSHDVTDKTGHGTFVSGVIAATRNNSVGIAGICDDVTIIPLKCFGDGAKTDASYIIEAIYEAVDTYKCDVINLSLGISQNLASMKAAVDYAASKGIIVVAAVGNEGTRQIFYPAAYDNVIGVGAVGKNGEVCDFSQKNSTVFVTAPGNELCSLGISARDAYMIGGGTSYATPHVVAAAVIMKQNDRTADYLDFQELLKSSSIDRGAVGYDTEYGNGELNIAAFVKALEAYSFKDIGDVFPDVKNHWAKENIAFCYDRQYFEGVSAGVFAPELAMNRGMFVTVLSRLCGEPITGAGNSFSDVAADAYYAKACAWAAAAGISDGTGDGRFNPEGKVTREEMAVFLYRFAKLYKLVPEGYTPAAPTGFKDWSRVSGWAKEAVSWAVEKGLLTGRDGALLSPGDGAKRAEVAAIVNRFDNSVMADKTI